MDRSKDIRDSLQNWAHNRLHMEEDVPWTTIKKALAEIEKLIKNANREDVEYLNEVKALIDKY